LVCSRWIWFWFGVDFWFLLHSCVKARPSFQSVKSTLGLPLPSKQSGYLSGDGFFNYHFSLSVLLSVEYDSSTIKEENIDNDLLGHLFLEKGTENALAKYPKCQTGKIGFQR
jgi:hypothetical protein